MVAITSLREPLLIRLVVRRRSGLALTLAERGVNFACSGGRSLDPFHNRFYHDGQLCSKASLRSDLRQ